MTYVIIAFFSAILSAICFLFIIIGLISPKAGLFWYKRTQTRLFSTIFYSLLCIVFFFLSIVLFYVGAAKEGSGSDTGSTSVTNPIDEKADSIKAKGDTLYDKHQLAPALAEYQKIIDMNLDTSNTDLKDDLENAYEARAKVYSDMNKPELAVKDHTLALQLDPNNTEYLTSRANNFIDMENYDEALKDANALIKRDTTVDNYYLRGRIYKYKKDYAHALTDFNIALGLDSNNIRILEQIDEVKFDMEDYKGALALNEQILRIDKSNTLALANGGLCKANLGRYKEGLADIEQAIKEDDKNGSYFRARGWIKRMLDRPGDCDDFIKARSLGENVDKYLKGCNVPADQ